ncbi:MAG: RNA polymerase sigma factor [archaeon]
MTLFDSFYIGVDRTSELTVEEEKAFVRERDKFPVKSEPRERIVDNFSNRSFYLLERMMTRYNGKYSSGFLLDLAHEFMFTHRKCCDHFKADARYSTFLYRATSNHFLNSLRRLNRGESREESLDEVHLSGKVHYLVDNRDALNLSLQSERAECINRNFKLALEQLNPDQRTAFLMSLEDLSSSEIAVLTNTSEGTVRSRLFYARKILQANMDSGLLVK